MRLPLVLVLAQRNLLRNTRRSLIMILAVALGVWAMLVMAAFARGWLDQQLRATLDTLTGHVQIHAPGYLDDPALAHRLPASGAGPGAGLLRDPQVVAWAQRLRVPAVVASERDSAGVTLVGIDPRRERGLSFIGAQEAIAAGRGLQGPGDTGLVLGRRLARRLETGVGRRVVLLSQDRNNEIVERGFRVVGLYRAEQREAEERFAFTGLAAAQSFLGVPGEVTEFSLRLRAPGRLQAWLAAARVRWPDLEITPWTELAPLVVVFIRTFEGFMYIWFGVVFVIVGFGLVNTLLMAVFERTREIGLLEALGMRPVQVVAQILWEALLLLLAGAALGNLLAGATRAWLAGGIDLTRFAAGMELFQSAHRIYLSLDPVDVLAANLLVLVLGTAAAAYPAWRAARIPPTRALRGLR